MRSSSCSVLVPLLPFLISISHFIASSTAIVYAPYQSYYSSPFNPPVLAISTSSAHLAPGYLFLTPGIVNPINPTAPKQTAAFIMTDDGELVWSSANNTFANDLKVQTLHSDPVLIYWTGIELAGKDIGHYYGAVHVLDASYQELYRICPDLNVLTVPGVVTDCYIDGHEAVLTDQGTLIFTVYNVTSTDLSSIGGPVEGWIYDCLFYEYDIATKEILYRWSAIENVPVSGTHRPMGANGNNASFPFDYFHINSVQQLDDGWLVNARHTWAVYKLDRTGAVTWILEGSTGGDFGPLPTNGHFTWQHDAQLIFAPHSPNTPTLLMFNNWNTYMDNGSHPSTSLSLRLDLTKNTSTFISAFSDPANPLYADGQGNAQPLPNGNTIVFYGLSPVIQEFGPTGDLLYSASFGPLNQVQSYRVYKQKWNGAPKTVPSVAVVGYGTANGTSGYVSWNGATEVTKWAIYEAKGADNQLVRKRTVKKKGFETQFAIGVNAAYVQVVAYNGRTPIGESAVVSVCGNGTYAGASAVATVE